MFPATHIVTSLHEVLRDQGFQRLSRRGRNRFGLVIVLEMTIGRVVWTMDGRLPKDKVMRLGLARGRRRISGNC